MCVFQPVTQGNCVDPPLLLTTNYLRMKTKLSSNPVVFKDKLQRTTKASNKSEQRHQTPFIQRQAKRLRLPQKWNLKLLNKKNNRFWPTGPPNAIRKDRGSCSENYLFSVPCITFHLLPLNWVIGRNAILPVTSRKQPFSFWNIHATKRNRWRNC